VAFALVLVAAALSYRSAMDVQEAAAGIGSAFQIRREAQVVLILVTDAETGQRGYLLTGDAAYLSPYERAMTSLPDALQRFRALTSDSPEQKRRVDELNVLLDEKMAELAATVAAKRTGGVDAALEIVRTGRGRALMARIRQMVGAIIDEQSRRLEERQAEVTRRTREAIYITVGVLVLAMAATSFATVMMLRNVREHERARAARAEQAVREEAVQRLAAIVDNSDDAIIGKDLNGVIASWNRGAERIFGYRAEEAIGQPITIIIPPDRREEEETVLRRLRAGEHTDHFETVRWTKQGQLIDISLTVSPIRNAEGTVIGASKIARDITERKRVEAELKRLNETLEDRVAERTRQLAEINTELDAFGYTVSHDLRAPLRAMDGFAKALVEDFGDTLGARGQDYARRIVDAAVRMDMLIQDLLAYSRLSRGDVRLQPVNLGELAREALDGLAAEVRQRAASVSVADPLGSVFAHHETLRQVITNLLSNALKFVAPGVTPRVRIWSESRGDMARLWVEDDGIGIDPRYHANIFRVFERLHGVETFPGTGIGLAIVRRGTERMGGRVGVESKPGAGSRFWIELATSRGRDGS
jgi:PAS domain S-box-containing protein